MRVSTHHLKALSTAIEPLDTAELRATYVARDFPRAELVKDLDKRYRWDLAYASGAMRELRDSDYADSHIDTALRHIVPAL
jgi:hypothetical protein